MIVYFVYQTTSPGIIVFPLVFVLTFVAATGQQPFLLMSPGLRKGWLFAHIALIFTGYAALVLSFGASLAYLLQETQSEVEEPGRIFSQLPALQVIDEIGYRSLLLGFPFMTLGLIAGSVVAQARFGRVDLLDPKVFLSVLMWVVYLIMVYTRWNAGWRGRRAALLASFAFVLRSWRGRQITSAPYTGSFHHEISAHRRESQHGAGRGARAAGDPGVALAGGLPQAGAIILESKRA